MASSTRTISSVKITEFSHGRGCKIAPDTMCQLNSIDAELSKLDDVKALREVTGFGLAGHLVETCEGSHLGANLNYQAVPKLAEVENYLAQGCSPGGAQCNLDSYSHKLAEMNHIQRQILCAPQTSGRLPVAVSPEPESEQVFLDATQAESFQLTCIGELHATQSSTLITIDDC